MPQKTQSNENKTKTMGSSFRDDTKLKDEMATIDIDTWDTNELASFLKNKAKLGDYSEMFVHHKISGRIAPLLTDQDLKDMGITIVGDRLRIKSLLHHMKWKKRYQSRNKVIWEDTERLYYSNAEQMCWTCCGLFPDDPSTYKLTNTHLKIKTVDPLRCGPIKCCCCYEYHVNNVDLSKIDDVDVVGVPSPCFARVFCCAPGKEIVELKTSTEDGTTGTASNSTKINDNVAMIGKLNIILKSGQGEHVSQLIMNQIEEAQVLERD